MRIKLGFTELLLLLILTLGFNSYSQEHPNLILTKTGVEKIRASLGEVELFDASLEKAKQEVDAEIAKNMVENRERKSGLKVMRIKEVKASIY